MASARLGSVQRIDTHELGEFEKVRNTVRILERLVQLLAPTDDTKVVPELVTQLRDPGESLAQTSLRSGHPALVPHEPAEFLVE